MADMLIRELVLALRTTCLVEVIDACARCKINNETRGFLHLRFVLDYSRKL